MYAANGRQQLRPARSGRAGGRIRRSRIRRASLNAVERLEDRRLLSTYTVDSLGDSGDGTLRWAITQANQNPGDDTIDFAVTGTITLESTLPTLSDTTGITDISGPGDEIRTVAGNGDFFGFRIFTVDTAARVALAGLKACL
jgi:hypothetical protein